MSRVASLATPIRKINAGKTAGWSGSETLTSYAYAVATGFKMTQFYRVTPVICPDDRPLERFIHVVC